jgi:hypothetical protein
MSIDRRSFLTGVGAAAISASMPAYGIRYDADLIRYVEQECQKALYDLLLNADPIQPRYIFGSYDAETRFLKLVMDPEYARKFSRYSGAADTIEGVEEAEGIAAAPSESWFVPRLSQEVGQADRGNERLGRLLDQVDIQEQFAGDDGVRRYLASECIEARDRPFAETMVAQFRQSCAEVGEVFRDRSSESERQGAGEDPAGRRVLSSLPDVGSNEGRGPGDDD